MINFAQLNYSREVGLYKGRKKFFLDFIKVEDGAYTKDFTVCVGSKIFVVHAERLEQFRF